MVDPSVTGAGTSFATFDATNGIQALQAGDFISAAPTLLTLGGNTVNGNTTVTMTNTTGLVAGQLVTGTGIALGTTITTVNAGVSIVLSANATATANNTLAFYTGAGTYANLVSTSATNALGSASAAMELNSLTLNNTAGAA